MRPSSERKGMCQPAVEAVALIKIWWNLPLLLGDLNLSSPSSSIQPTFVLQQKQPQRGIETGHDEMVAKVTAKGFGCRGGWYTRVFNLKLLFWSWKPSSYSYYFKESNEYLTIDFHFINQSAKLRWRKWNLLIKNQIDEKQEPTKQEHID